MDFFAAQAEARRRTALLLGLFVLVVLMVIGVLDLLATGLHLLRYGRPPPLQVHAWVTGSALALIVGGSLWRTAELRDAAGTLARLLHARPVDDPDLEPRAGAEQLLRYRNAAAEVAIAAGAPVPRLYLLPRQQAINALAAGSATGNAALFLTAGALQRLEREELLGVLAHEFGHLLSGDGRLNTRLLGALHGLLMVSHFGRWLLGQERSAGALRAAGLVLLAIGSLGVFAGRLLRAAVSRQREFQADASAVRLTRNPEALLGALRKIRLGRGSPGEDSLDREFEHMLFSAVHADTGRASWLATHPPLRERIARISGQMTLSQHSEHRSSPSTSVSGHEVMSTAAARHGKPVTAQGAPGALPGDLERARAWQHDLPDALRDGGLSPVQAVDMMAALLGAGAVAPLVDAPETLTPGAMWSLACRLVPVIAALPPARQRRVHQALRNGLLALSRLSPLHLAAWLLLRHHLAPPRGGRASSERCAEPEAAEVLLLSLLAHAGSSDPAAAAHAFSTAAAVLGLEESALMPTAACRLAALEAALDRLAAAPQERRRRWLRAAVILVAADEVTLRTEQALLHAIAESLDCPLPAGATVHAPHPSPVREKPRPIPGGTLPAQGRSNGPAAAAPLGSEGRRAGRPEGLTTDRPRRPAHPPVGDGGPQTP